LIVALSLLPISEIRGALPLALLNHWPFWQAFIFCVVLNSLVGPIVYLFLSTLHKLLINWPLYARFFDKFVNRARNKLQKEIQKYGYWGLVIFIGIPLPVTGAYTGALGAWVLGLEPKKVFLCVVAGVLMSGTLVSLAYYGATTLGLGFLKIFFAK
jgi:uncharacterized membrane protein